MSYINFVFMIQAVVIGYFTAYHNDKPATFKIWVVYWLYVTLIIAVALDVFFGWGGRYE